VVAIALVAGAVAVVLVGASSLAGVYGLGIAAAVFRKNLIVLGFRQLFTAPLFPFDIRGADRPGQNSLPLGDHTEFGDSRLAGHGTETVVKG